MQFKIFLAHYTHTHTSIQILFRNSHGLYRRTSRKSLHLRVSFNTSTWNHVRNVLNVIIFFRLLFLKPLYIETKQIPTILSLKSLRLYIYIYIYINVVILNLFLRSKNNAIFYSTRSCRYKNIRMKFEGKTRN